MKTKTIKTKRTAKPKGRRGTQYDVAVGVDMTTAMRDDLDEGAAHYGMNRNAYIRMMLTNAIGRDKEARYDAYTQSSANSQPGKVRVHTSSIPSGKPREH